MITEENKINSETEETVPANETVTEDEGKKKKSKSSEAELKKVQKELETVKSELADINDKYVRMLAEYDNFRRRSQKERESVYSDAYTDAISEMLPIIDNLERAAQYNDAESVTKGVQMILKACEDIFTKLGVTEIEAKEFDPTYHNAVMHVEDEAYGEGEIVEVLQKGYIKGDKIIRYAMVKVAN